MTHTAIEYSHLDDDTAVLVGLPPTDGGYGLLHCLTDDGKHVTRAGDPFVTISIAAGIELTEAHIAERMPFLTTGWPDDKHFGRTWITDPNATPDKGARS